MLFCFLLVYTNLEEFDKDWLEWVYSENDGNLYKCTYPTDLVYLGGNPDIYKNIPSSSVTGGTAYDLADRHAGKNSGSDLRRRVGIH